MLTSDEQRHIVHSIGDYFISSTIGHGSSGRVKLGIHQITGQKVAIKIIPRSQLNSSIKITQAVERELAVLQLLHHPNLIDLHQVLQDEYNVYFVTEYVPGGELYYVLTDRGRLSENEARNIFGQIASALSWCHARNICHRDLKPENILLDKDRKNIKIADFGMATMQSSNALLKTSCGSPHYASPEIIRGIPYYGPSADVWSAGIILYVLLTGKLPFDDRHVGRLLAKIKTGRFKKIPDWVSSSAEDLIYRILVVDPNQRISFNDILSHPWMVPFTSTITPVVVTTMLSIHSFSLQCNPWHDDQLKNPLILNSGDLQGPTKETLKVLWRDLSNDQIVSALMDKNPNLQKLTYQLLQQRLKRQFVERSTDSIAKNPKFNICNTANNNYLLSSSSSSKQSPSSYSNNTVTTACDDSISTQINNLLSRTSLSSPELTFNSNNCNSNANIIKNREYSSLSALPTILLSSCPPQSQPNRKTAKPIVGSPSSSLLDIPQQRLLYPSLITVNLSPTNTQQHQHQTLIICDKSIPTTHETILSTLSATHQNYNNNNIPLPSPLSLIDHRLKNHLLLFSSKKRKFPYCNKLLNSHKDIFRHTIATASYRVKNYVQDRYNRFLSAIFNNNAKKKQQQHRRVIRQEFAIQCMAKSEFIAAGKLHYILSDHFQGKLNGCMYPDGKILWSGEIDKTSFAVIEQQQHSKACFLCKIRIVSDSKSLYKLILIIHREDPLLVSSFANRLLDLLILYENESDAVIKANKWT